MLTVVRLAAEQKELRIVSDQIGAPTSSQAIADAVTKLVRSGLPSLRDRMGKCETVNVSCSGETSWFGFAEAIVDGLGKRNLGVRAERIMPIKSEDYPTRAARPRNSCRESTKARGMFSIRMPPWQEALDAELKALAELRGITFARPMPAVVDRLERSPTES